MGDPEFIMMGAMSASHPRAVPDAMPTTRGLNFYLAVSPTKALP